MTHLTSERLMALGLDLDASLAESEQRHLTSCASCAEALRMERELTARLALIEQPAVPAELASGARTKFRAAAAKRRARHLAWSLAASLGLGLASAAVLVGLLVLNAQAVVHGLALGFENVLVLLHVVAVVFGSVPLLPLFSVAGACVVTVAVSSGLGRLAMAQVAK